MNKPRYIALLILALLPFGLHAQQLTIDSCFSLARRNNSDLQKAALDIRMAQEVKRQLFTKFFPSIDATGLGFYAAQPLVGIDVTSIAQTEDFRDLLEAVYELLHETDPNVSKELSWIKQGYLFSAKAVQPIYAGGRILNGNRLANVGVEAAQFKAQVSERDILQEVEETYWLLSGLYEKRHTVTQVRQLLDTISLVAQTAFDAGVVTNNDLLKVQLKKNEIETQALRLENGIRLATHALCHQLGIPVQDSLPLQSLPTENIAELQLNTAINPENRPEYHLLDLNVKAEELRRQLILGEALPTLAIGGSVSTSNLFEQNRNNAIVFAVASIPLSEWWNTSHKIKEADIKVQEAQLMRDDLQGKMHLQNEQVYNALTEAARLMGQHQSAILMAQDNYDLSLANYEAGLATMSELLESQALLLQAQNNYTDSRITYRTNLRKFKQLNK